MKEKNKKLIALVVVIITLIRLIISFIQFNFKYASTSQYTSYNVKIINEEKRTEEKIVYLVALEQNGNYTDKFILNVYDNNELLLSKGCILNIVGKINIPQLLGNPR